MKASPEKKRNVRQGPPDAVVRIVVVALLLAALCAEGYYIYLLSETIRKQTEDLRSISLQLQLLKSEREALKKEISSVRTEAGEDHETDTAQGQHR